jgi:excisionase family DNA binding protein
MSLSSLDGILKRSAARGEALSGRSSGPIHKSLTDYAELAVGPVYRHTVAEWILDRNMFVRQYRNSVAIGVGTIARKMAMQEVKILRRFFRKSGPIIEPADQTLPLCELFRNINPMFTEWDLWYYTEGWKLLTGNAYWWKGRNLFGLPTELWVIPSQWVRAIPSRTQYIGAYEIRNLFRTEHPVILPGTEINQLDEPNLDQNANGRFYGQPPIIPAAASIDIEDKMYDRLRWKMTNFAEPGQIFSTDKPLTEYQLRQIYNQIVNQHTLVEHTGRPMITHSGLKPMVTPSARHELDFKDSFDVTMTLILAIFGVPKAVAGLTVDVNRCLSADTECLTADGWKRYDELTKETKIACFDDKTGAITYSPPKNIFVTNYDGEMLHWKSENADICVTPNHRLYGLVGDKWTKRSGPWRIKQASEWAALPKFQLLSTAPAGAACVTPTSVSIEYPKATLPPKLKFKAQWRSFTVSEAARATGVNQSVIYNWIDRGLLQAWRDDRDHLRIASDVLEEFQPPRQGGPAHRGPIDVKVEDWMEFLGWFVSEGSTNKREYRHRHTNGSCYDSVQYSVFLTQKEGVKEQQIQAILNRMPFHWQRCKIGRKNQIQWVCNDKGLWQHLSLHCGKGVKNKRLPQYIKEYPARLLRLLFASAVAGDGRISHARDGSESTVGYTTISRQLADDMHELAIKCGYRASMREESRKTVTGNTVYTLNCLRNRLEFSFRNSQNLTREHYRGKVWCVEVPTGMFLVRLNGKVHVTGNSNSEAALLTFCENCVNPRLKHNSQHLSKSLAKEFEPDGSLICHFEPCTVNDVEDMRKTVETCAKTGATTPNEIREILLHKGRFIRGGDRPSFPSAAVMAQWGNDPNGDDPGLEPPIKTSVPNLGIPGQNGAPTDQDQGDAPNRMFGAGSNGHAKPGMFGRRKGLFKADHSTNMLVVRDWERTHIESQEPFGRAVHEALQKIKHDALSRFRTFSGIKKSLSPVSSNGNGQHGMFGHTRLAKAVGPDAVANLVPTGRSERILMDACDEHIFASAVAGAELELKHVHRITKSVTAPDSPRLVTGLVALPHDLVDRIRDHVTETFGMDYWLLVTEAARQMLRETLTRSLVEGWTNTETVEFITKDADHVFDEVRSKRIVQTETTGAVNSGTYVAQQRFMDSGEIDGRIWSGILDQRQRNTHRETTDQQIVKRGGTWVCEKNGIILATGREFIVGGERARFAGDPSLSAEERIACRCLTLSLVE